MPSPGCNWVDRMNRRRSRGRDRADWGAVFRRGAPHHCLDERICSDDGRAPSYPCFLSLKTRCLAKTLPYANAAYPPISAVSTAGHFSRQTC